MASHTRQIFRFVAITSFSRPGVFAYQQRAYRNAWRNPLVRTLSTTVSKASQLAEVGKLEPVKIEGNYDTGQLFLHRIFGYRGVVLFSWNTRVHDRDVPVNSGEKYKESGFPKSLNPNKNGDNSKDKEIKGQRHPYYTVLIDTRDCQYLVNRAQTESVTFLGSASERNLFAIPGLDYVAHEDVIPYTSSETTPIQHELFQKFLAPTEDGTLQAQSTLHNLLETNHPYLELCDVHKETTENIRVTVMPFYMGFREQQQKNSKVWWWRYCIRLENLGELSVQLRERNWRIFSLSGTLETVRGRGVMAQEPILSKDQPAFQYSSHVSLQAPSGHMWGTFRMEREDGYSFDCRIPPFSLESNTDDNDDPIIGN